MGVLDAYIIYRIVKGLVTDFDQTDAFKLGVIDASGKLMKPVNQLDNEQLNAYSIFNRLVFNLKRLIQKVPGGKSKLGTYAAALLLFREELGDEEGVIVLERSFMNYLKENNAIEETFLAEQYLPEEMLSQGNYKLLDDILDTQGELVPKGTIIVAKQSMKATARVLGVDVFKLQVAKTGKQAVISREDITEV